jgi:Gram-negative bacterial TonB protein C-terminal
MRKLILGAGLALLFGSGSAQAQQAIDPVSAWIVPADYPADAAGKGQGGLVTMRFRIAASGRVEKCKSVFTSAPMLLTRISCQRIEERARYAPAHDRTGTPVESEGELTARWRPETADVEVTSRFGGAMPIGNPGAWMTDDDYAQVTQGRGDADAELVFEIGTEGRVTRCGFTALGNAKTSERTCKLLTQRARFRPPVGDHGEPLVTQGTLTMLWRH